MLGDAYTGPTGDRQKRTSLVENHAYAGPAGDQQKLSYASRDMAWESEQMIPTL